MAVTTDARSAAVASPPAPERRPFDNRHPTLHWDPFAEIDGDADPPTFRWSLRGRPGPWEPGATQYEVSRRVRSMRTTPCLLRRSRPKAPATRAARSRGRSRSVPQRAGLDALKPLRHRARREGLRPSPADITWSSRMEAPRQRRRADRPRHRCGGSALGPPSPSAGPVPPPRAKFVFAQSSDEASRPHPAPYTSAVPTLVPRRVRPAWTQTLVKPRRRGCPHLHVATSTSSAGPSTIPSWDALPEVAAKPASTSSLSGTGHLGRRRRSARPVRSRADPPLRRGTAPAAAKTEGQGFRALACARSAEASFPSQGESGTRLGRVPSSDSAFSLTGEPEAQR